MVPTPRPDRASWLPLLLVALLPLWLDSCTSTPPVVGVPDKLPDIALAGSPATPPHHLANYEYPFDPEGNYVESWAAEGERHFGRPTGATNEDEEKWSTSHGGKSTGPSKAAQKRKEKANHEEERHAKAHKSSDKSEDKPKKTAKKSSSDKSETKSKTKSSKSDDDDKPKKKSSTSGKKSDTSDKSSQTKSKSSSSKKSGESSKKSEN